MAAEECIEAVRKASKGKLSDDEITAVFEAIDRTQRRIEAEGKIEGLNEKLLQAAKDEGDKVRILAALQRKHAALNAIARDRIDTHIGNLVAAGVRPDKAILALMEGTQKGVAGGRHSVAATKLAYEAKFMGRMLADIQADKPHIIAMLGDEKFNDDIVREMFELREGGKPGKTGNADAQFAAKVFAKHAEVSRVEMNRLGALIGKLDGWAGPQTHDSAKMLKQGEEAWVKSILPRLDVERSFPDIAGDPDALRKTLHSVYETIITGRDREVGPREKGEFVGPANLARKQGEHRVLHFKDADAWLAYRDEFGYGSLFSSMITHQRRAAAIAAQMEMFGPNPAVMLGSVIDAQLRNVREGNLSSAEKTKLINKLSVGQLGASGGAIRNAYMEMSGLTSAPHAPGMTAARVMAGVRAHAAAAKLGGAVLTALPTDQTMAGLAGMFRGSGFWNTFTHQIGGLLQGRPKGEQAKISYLIGEGYDGLISHILEPFHVQDAPIGLPAKMAEKVFRWSGMTWQTDVGRSVAGRMIAAELGMHAKTPFDKLPARYRHVLGLHGIDAKQWALVGDLAFKAENGNTYVTPDRAAGLSDEAIAPLVADREALFPKFSVKKIRDNVWGVKHDVDKVWLRRDFKGENGAHLAQQWLSAHAEEEAKKLGLTDRRVSDKAHARYQAAVRRDLEMALHRFIADETNFGIIETDPRSRRLTLHGSQSGTWAGEAWRTMMQFKGFPIAFTDRVLGRAFMGAPGDNWKERMTNNLPHIGALMAGLTLAGYASITAKDAARGYWPPREPDWKTVLASLKQGGGAGIYGDFLFGEANRFAGTVAETAAGPVAGDIFKMIDIFRGVTQGEKRGKAAFDLAVSNTPFVNLWYTRAALDTLFLNSMREALSPGALHRQEERRRKEYGQQSFIPRTLN